jgi:hypothetical protein
MDWRDLPDDLRTLIMRLVDAAGRARFELTSFDLNMALPHREIRTEEVEAVMACLTEHGIQLLEDPEDI